MRVLLRLFVAALIVAVILAVLYPLYAGALIPSCYLIGADRKPIAGKAVTVHCDGKTAERTTDGQGGFDPPSPCRDRAPDVDGCGLAFTSGHTGTGPFHRYHFSPLGTLWFRFLDEKGTLLKGLGTVTLNRDGKPLIFGPGAEIRISDAPLAARRVNYRVSRPDLRLKKVERNATANSVTYDLTFETNPHPGPDPQWYSKLG